MGMAEIGKLKIATLVLVFISICLLVAGMATRWYYINYADTVNGITYDISMYSPKIVTTMETLTMSTTTSDNMDWGDFDLKNTRNIFNTGLAFSAFAFMIGFFIIIITILNQIGILRNEKIWTIARFMVIGMLICTFISVCVMAGTTKAFEKDEDDGTKFIFCYKSCDSKWRGTASVGGLIVKFGPGTGWILVIISLFVEITATICVVLSFISRPE
ncbi:hypothetical protein ACTFIY_003101 [Dictyostelium cf. discoideum]